MDCYSSGQGSGPKRVGVGDQYVCMGWSRGELKWPDRHMQYNGLLVEGAC